MFQRPRRIRKNNFLRDLVVENSLSSKDLIYPLFLLPVRRGKEEITSMPGRKRLGLENVFEEIDLLLPLGLRCICLFPVVPEDLKNSEGSYSYQEDCFYLLAIREIKKRYPDLLVMTDIALDPYSSDGHDGIVDKKNGVILNDETLEVLGKMGLAQAEAGADILGPSDMMDGRVGHIREELEKQGFINTVIMSYTAKYASSFYGPFREALDSAPKFGDKKTYQMNPGNTLEALKEAELDTIEGADILMVKPGMPYLDIIKLLRDETELPIAAYQVSGEFAMIQAAAEKGWIDLEGVTLESLLSFKRAGASMILSYFTPEALKLLKRL